MISLWDPRNDALSLRDAMSRLFENSFVTTGLGPQAGVALDVVETAEAFVIKASLPGCEKDRINVSFENDTLTIQAELNGGVANEKGRYLVRERFAGKVSRSMSLPLRVDAERANAEYVDGVLTLTLPKSETVKARSIQIG